MVGAVQVFGVAGAADRIEQLGLFIKRGDLGGHVQILSSKWITGVLVYIIIELMLAAARRVVNNFGFLKSVEDKFARDFEFGDISSRTREKEIRPPISDVDAIKIPLSRLKFESLPDNINLAKVPQLKHGLDKYLNGELVFGDEGIGNLPQGDKLETSIFKQISGYIEPSNDQQLISKAKKANCRYFSSTSSISNPLIALYYLFSNFRLPEMDNIFSGVPSRPVNWMISYRKPVTFYLIPDGDNYSIVSDKGILPPGNQVLMDLGHIMEFFLTHTKDETDLLMRGQYQVQPDNYYRYAKVNDDLLLRSQIDCMSYDQKGKPYVFEIKSRACAPIRYAVTEYKEYMDYEINSKRGLFESFEREYYDLIRGGFLKYVMQVKIGGMDGAFIAYHNTQKIYGYEYVKMKEMALRVFGDDYNLDVAFVCTSKMLTVVLDEVRSQFADLGKVTFKMGFFSEYRFRKLIVMVEPMVQTTSYPVLTKAECEAEGITETMDYYQKREPLKNPVYKMEFTFFIYMNGVRLLNPDVLLTPHDSLDMKYKCTKKIRATNIEYKMFLREAYKEDEIFNSTMYRGMWGYESSE